MEIPLRRLLEPAMISQVGCQVLAYRHTKLSAWLYAYPHSCNPPFYLSMSYPLSWVVLAFLEVEEASAIPVVLAWSFQPWNYWL